MFFDLFLAGIFFASATALWYRISLKIPELVAVSDAVIVERLHEDSAKIRIFLLHFKAFYREGRHRVWLWRWCEKICHRAHIVLLRADNAVVALLQKIRVAGNGASAPIAGGDAGNDVPANALNAAAGYWSKFRPGPETEAGQTEKGQSLPRHTRAVWQKTGRHEMSEPHSAGAGRIQEVRRKRMPRPADTHIQQKLPE